MEKLFEVVTKTKKWYFIVLGVGIIFLFLCISYQNFVPLEKNIYVSKLESVQEVSKIIYLTFDDGPSVYTGMLLDILKKYDAKATFFVTNQKTSYGYDEYIKRAYDEGHAIGLHTNSHIYSYIYASVDNYFADLYAIQDKVKRITGYESYIVRFPGGSSNTISKNYDGGAHIMSVLTPELEKRGFRYFDWNVLSGDAGGTTNSVRIASNVIKALKNEKSYMILQHDTKKYSIKAVESIIQFGLEHGYVFRAIDDDAPVVHHNVYN